MVLKDVLNGHAFIIKENTFDNSSNIPENVRIIQFGVDWTNPDILVVFSHNPNVTNTNDFVNVEATKLNKFLEILMSRWKGDFINELLFNLPEDISLPFGMPAMYFNWDDNPLTECVGYGHHPKINVPANTGSLPGSLALIAVFTVYLMMTSIHMNLVPILKRIMDKYSKILLNDQVS